MSEGWIKTERGWRKRYGPPKTEVRPGNYPCPRIATDTMDLTEHVDGKFYDSKSAYRAVTKANGMVEIGNDPARLRKPEKPKADPKARREAVDRAISKILA